MAKQQGKVKAIPIKEACVGMQVMLFDGRKNVVLRIAENNKNPYKNDEVSLMYVQGNKKDFKTIVVEYEQHEQVWPRSGRDAGGHEKYGMVKHQLPLKYSQWQSAIDNDEIDSDKLVEFQDKLLDFEYKTNQYDVEVISGSQYIAKIIPQKKKLYTEEEMVNAIVTLNVRAVDACKKNPNMDSLDLVQNLNTFALDKFIKR